MSKKKPVLLHCHIFKNAGTTIEWILKKNFRKNAVSISDIDNPGKIISNEIILNYLSKNPDIKAISSHQIRFPPPSLDKTKFIPLLFVRHPIDRVFSVYEFKRKMKDDSLGTLHAKKLSLKEFVSWSLSKNYMVVENYQVHFLSSTVNNSTNFNLVTAKNNVTKCPIIGVVDKMDNSLVLAEEILRTNFPSIDLSYVKQNVTREGNLEEKIKHETKKIGIDLIKKLESSNKKDLDLYYHSVMELEKRIKNIDNFEEKLENFQLRCAKRTLSKLNITLPLLHKFQKKFLNQFEVR